MLVLVTEWRDYRRPNFQRLAGLMRGKAVFDGRNNSPFVSMSSLCPLSP